MMLNFHLNVCTLSNTTMLPISIATRFPNRRGELWVKKPRSSQFTVRNNFCCDKSENILTLDNQPAGMIQFIKVRSVFKISRYALLHGM